MKVSVFLQALINAISKSKGVSRQVAEDIYTKWREPSEEELQEVRRYLSTDDLDDETKKMYNRRTYCRAKKMGLPIDLVMDAEELFDSD